MPWYKLVLYAMITAIFWQATYYFSKELMVLYDITPFELLLFRTFFISVVSISQKSWKCPREHRRKLIFSALLFVPSLMLNYVGVKYLPIAIITIILQSKQFGLLLLGYCILRETLTVLEVVAMIISFVAMVLIALNDPNQEGDSPYSVTQSQYILGFIAGIFSVLTFAMWLILIRRMKGLNHWIIQLYSNTSAWIALAIYLLVDWQFVSKRTPFASLINGIEVFEGVETAARPWKAVGILFLSSICGLLGQSFMMITNQACNPARVALLDYIGIVYSFVIDIFLL